METSLHGSQRAGPNAGRKDNLARLGGPRPVDGAAAPGAITGTMPERGPARLSCSDPPADRNNAQTERYASRSVIRQRWPLALFIEAVLGSRFGARLSASIKKRLSTFQISYGRRWAHVVDRQFHLVLETNELPRCIIFQQLPQQPIV